MIQKERNITSTKSYRRAEDDELYQSRADIKADIAEVRELGLALSVLSNAELAKIALSEEILEAIATAKKIPLRNDAYRRHQSYLCKLLRNDDVEAIQKAYDRIMNKHNQVSAELEKLEVVREKLIAEGDPAINDLLEQYPMAERQKLRQLIRQANKEKKLEKPAKAAKEIFKYLRELSGI